MGQKEVCPVEPGEVNNRWLENQERLTTGWQGILTPRNPLKTHLPAYSWGGRGCRAGTNSPETRDNKGTSQQGKSRLHHLHTLGWIWTLLKEVSIPLSERSAAVGAASLSLPSYILRCVDSFSINTNADPDPGGISLCGSGSETLVSDPDPTPFSSSYNLLKSF